MLITIRRRWLLRIFGWGWFMGKRRTEWPSYVTASHRRWWFWLWNRHKSIKPMDESALRNHTIVI